MPWQILPNVSLSPGVKKRVKWLATTLSRMKLFCGSMVSIIPLSGAAVTVSDKPSSNNLFAFNNAEVKSLVNVCFQLTLA